MNNILWLTALPVCFRSNSLRLYKYIEDFRPAESFKRNLFLSKGKYTSDNKHIAGSRVVATVWIAHNAITVIDVNLFPSEIMRLTII